MISRDFAPEWIRELHKIADQITDTDVHMPSEQTQSKAKGIIEDILPPDYGRVNRPYVKSVLIALEYAKTHICQTSGKSMLEDIQQGKSIDVSKYM